MFALALLHAGATVTWWPWSVHLSTLVGIAALIALYTGAGRQLGRSPTRTQRLLFFSGLAVMFASLNGPLHDLSDSYLFSAHMLQHLLLTMIMAPLLVAGVPGWMLRPVVARPAIGPIARFVTRAPVCFCVFSLVLVVWHLPPFYNAALANHNIHIVQHLFLMVAAVLMWWPLLSPLPELPRLSYPGQMLYTFVTGIPMWIVAVYITMADHILYPAYSTAARVFPLSPRDDQLLGGLIMWVPGSLMFIIIMTVIFFKWNARGEDSTAGAQVDWKPSAA